MGRGGGLLGAQPERTKAYACVYILFPILPPGRLETENRGIRNVLTTTTTTTYYFETSLDRYTAPMCYVML
jgi:hypothetical protein